MTRYETLQVTQAYRTRCEDRVAVLEESERSVIVVADGAGGVGSGDAAAEAVIREVRSRSPTLQTAEDWAAALEQIDFVIGAGQATAVVVDLRPEGICGASVGDSQAWIFDDDVIDLTAGQQRKPLLGTGEARAVGFSRSPLAGLLVVGTDGLFNYVKRQQLQPLVAQTDFFALPRTLLELVRLPSGQWWDDVGLVLCRRRPQQRTRQRYQI